jgi:thymidylate synthase
MYIVENTLDDALRRLFQKLLTSGRHITPSRGAATEFTGVLIKLRRPLSRLSRTEAKGKLFSCLGELVWYMSGNDELAFITYYLSHYSEESDDGKTVRGAYGPRLYRIYGRDQFKSVIETLRKKPFSRRAVIQLFDASDVVHKGKGVPCTCTLQFLIRQGKLDLVVYMRSNDIFLGFPHDVFAFTMIQEILAKSLGVGLGTYNHAVGSLHLYDDHRKKAQKFLDEGWQSQISMPEMPEGEPWDALQIITRCEALLRNGEDIDAESLDIDPYWRDLIYILQVYSLSKTRQGSKIPSITKKMSSQVYRPYILKRFESPNR